MLNWLNLMEYKTVYEIKHAERQKVNGQSNFFKFL